LSMYGYNFYLKNVGAHIRRRQIISD